MRFYDIQITDPKTGKQVGDAHWTSYPNGNYDPGALNVVFNLVVTPWDIPVGGSAITIEGVDPQMLGQAKDWYKKTLVMQGGFGKGLPLATPSQSGIIAQGYVYQSFGNWIGTQVGLSFILLGSPFTQVNPGPLTLYWPAGTPLSQAIKNCFLPGFPNATFKMQFKDRVLPFDELHFGDTPTDIATMIARVTKSDPSGSVHIKIDGQIITAYDSSWSPKPKQLKFTDLIGQPTWLDPAQIQIRTALRGDIQVGDKVLMPTMPNGATFPNLPGFVQTSAASQPSQYKYQASMSGSFSVNKVRHVGNLRQPDGNAWITILDCAALTTVNVT